jgi:DNA polymerase I-like protein with 3'-5' exonuclease and polymerase domains
MDETDSNAKKYGYVEDFWGRRRRLPDIQRDRYEIIDPNIKTEFNPILFTKGIQSVENSNITKYKKLLSEARSKKDVDNIKTQAAQNGLTVKDNSGFVSRAERQCVNARVQGGAASMSKIAMRKIFDNEELRKLGFKLVLQIHDEVIGEVPKENAEKAGEILSQVMKTAVSDIVKVPFKCDVDISPCWYYSDFKSILKSEYSKLLGADEKTALDKLCEMHTECTHQQIMELLS